jgi:hypothetical protein
MLDSRRKWFGDWTNISQAKKFGGNRDEIAWYKKGLAHFTLD